MPAARRSLLARLSNMSWDELETRVRQEVSKRVDATLYVMGLQPGRDGLNPAAAPPGTFFFSRDDLPQRVALLRKHLPGQAAAIVSEADKICNHRFRLLGYRDLDYGKEIDWHLDAVHGLRSPLIPWFKIDFLDFESVGDHKVTWELSRHQHLVTLAKAWLLSGNEAYPQEIFAQWYSWQHANPYPRGANWASSLELAFRSLSWIWVDHLLADCSTVPSGFQDDLLQALSLHGRHIDRYLSTYFSPNTHLLGEAVALFFLGTLYPQIASAARWQREGWRIVQEEAVRQVRPDGVYFEQSLYYHVYALDFFLHARCLAARNGMEIPAAFDAVLQRMLAVVQSLSAAGPPDGFGDDDGGRVFDSSRNRADYMTDPLALGAALFPNDNLRASAPLTEEAIWLFGEQATSSASTRKSSTLTSEAFPDGGLYIIRSAEPVVEQMVIDAGPQGTGRSGHGHADALSVRLSVAGQRFLVDPGSCCYIGPGNDRDVFRGTSAQNTLAVDGLDQAQPEGPFAWSSLPEVKVDRWITGINFTLFAGSHSGYERLPQPVRHRRFVFHLHNSFWLIRDVAEGEGRHLLETSWHFSPDMSVTEQGSRFLALTNQPGHNQLDGLTFLPVEDQQWKSRKVSEFVSAAYGEKLTAPVIRTSAALALPAEHAVILATLGVQDSQNARLVRPECPGAYRFDTGEIRRLIIFGDRGALRLGPWVLDAKFVYYQVRNRTIEHMIVCDGTRIEFDSGPVLLRDKPLQWLEWTNLGGTQNIAASDESVRATFNGDPLLNLKMDI